MPAGLLCITAGDDFSPVDRSELMKATSGGRRLSDPHPEQGRIDLAIDGPITPDDVPVQGERLHALPGAGDADLVVCDVAALTDADAAALDALARLQLAAKRSGRRIRLGRPCDRLRDLLALCGLDEALPVADRLPLEPGGQPEQREQPLDVEEEGDPGDLSP
jgi:ABC-type transporter Mla MlaB component